MKKTVKRLLTVVLAATLCLSLCSCAQLDEMRQAQAFYNDDGTVSFQGSVYRPVNVDGGSVSFAKETFCGNLTKKKIPVLLSEIMGNRFLYSEGKEMLSVYRYAVVDDIEDEIGIGGAYDYAYPEEYNDILYIREDLFYQYTNADGSLPFNEYCIEKWVEESEGYGRYDYPLLDLSANAMLAVTLAQEPYHYYRDEIYVSEDGNKSVDTAETFCQLSIYRIDPSHTVKVHAYNIWEGEQNDFYLLDSNSNLLYPIAEEYRELVNSMCRDFSDYGKVRGIDLPADSL